MLKLVGLDIVQRIGKLLNNTRWRTFSCHRDCSPQQNGAPLERLKSTSQQLSKGKANGTTDTYIL